MSQPKKRYESQDRHDKFRKEIFKAVHTSLVEVLIDRKCMKCNVEFKSENGVYRLCPKHRKGKK